jgi:hypothetical protein
MSDIESEQPWRATPLHGQFSIKKIYVKDISFETPNSPQIFQFKWEPEMDVHLHSHSSKLDSAEYEVVLMVTAVVSVEGKTAFLAEAAVAGIFGTASPRTSWVRRWAVIARAYCFPTQGNSFRIWRRAVASRRSFLHPSTSRSSIGSTSRRSSASSRRRSNPDPRVMQYRVCNHPLSIGRART